MRVIVIGGGVLGLAAAIELAGRGNDVSLFDPGPIPHPLAESTDVSKVIRLDYGTDEDYVALGEHALDGWRRWNAQWKSPVFVETGVMFLSRAPLAPGGFEHDSFQLLTRRGHRLERLDASQIARRFPAYAPGVYVDGYFNPVGGWAQSAAVVARLVTQATARGVKIHGNRRVDLIFDGGVTAEGQRVPAELVVVCAGSWAAQLLPSLSRSLRAVGQPVFLFAPPDPYRFDARRFPVFGADIANTGFYGFPANREGLVKIASHGPGVPITSDDQRVVTAEQEVAVRAFLRESLPELATAKIVGKRLCVYCDTPDGHFWIARSPDQPKLVVATGGSGHAFKFAPVIGSVIADIALGHFHPLSHKFRWRPDVAAAHGDAARHLSTS